MFKNSYWPKTNTPESQGWVYTNTSVGPIVGPMKCKDCAKSVSGPYRFMRTVFGNVCQCLNCGHKDIEWAERLAYREEAERNERLDHMRDSREVILQRIKEAYEEGFNDAPRGRDCDFDDGPEGDWEVSNAKLVYDTLKELWGL